METTAMKATLHLSAVCFLSFFSITSFGSKAKPSVQANCELRLVSEAGAGAGEIFMSIFTPSEEECLKKADDSVEAQFRSRNGRILGKRGGIGPQP
jgi:hypothetical protein